MISARVSTLRARASAAACWLWTRVRYMSVLAILRYSLARRMMTSWRRSLAVELWSGYVPVVHHDHMTAPTMPRQPDVSEMGSTTAGEQGANVMPIDNPVVTTQLPKAQSDAGYVSPTAVRAADWRANASATM